MAFDKSKYDQEYNKQNIRRRFIPFNMKDEQDKELFDYLGSRGNITQYIKELIRADMTRNRSQNGSQPGE